MVMYLPTPLLTTKLYLPPPRPDLVPRLIEQLNAGIHSKLTLISAPAGFGKTTLVNAWVQQAEPRTRVAWLSLDAFGGFTSYTLLTSLHITIPYYCCITGVSNVEWYWSRSVFTITDLCKSRRLPHGSAIPLNLGAYQ